MNGRVAKQQRRQAQARKRAYVIDLTSLWFDNIDPDDDEQVKEAKAMALSLIHLPDDQLAQAGDVLIREWMRRSSIHAIPPYGQSALERLAEEQVV